MIDLASGSPGDKPADEVLRPLPQLPGDPPLTPQPEVRNRSFTGSRTRAATIAPTADAA